MKKEYSILVGGAAGLGSRAAGLIIGELFVNRGYYVFIYDDYQSLIKGGHSFSKIRVSEKKVLSHKDEIDFLLALDNETIEKHLKELKKDGIIIYDKSNISLKKENAYGVNLEEIIKKAKGEELMKNVGLVAFFAKTIGIEWQLVEKIIKEKFKKSKDLNIKVAKIAFGTGKKLLKIKKIKNKSISLLTGNQAIALGALKGGLDLYLAYPMTPSTGILHFLAKNKEKFKIKVFQLENEVGIINAALGASYAGARTMIGTSGGGFALMTEGLSAACQSETPVVIVESQRMSPGSGVPTYQGQGDLLFTLGAGHGDIIRFVIAPSDAEESAYWAGKALNLAWKFQTPTILLIDKEISESTFSFNKKILNKIKKEKPLLWRKKSGYLRYKITKNGISPLAFPGDKKVIVKSNSYEHNEFGITVEESEKVEKMQEKRLRKFEEMKKEVDKLPAVNIFGEKKSKKAIICWGSTKGPAKEAAEKLKIKMIQIIVLEPFPEKQIKKALKGVKEVILVETNGLGQLGRILNCWKIKVDKKILKYNGRPFTSEEIVEKISKKIARI